MAIDRGPVGADGEGALGSLGRREPRADSPWLLTRAPVGVRSGRARVNANYENSADGPQ
jgi:hypothetical protein